MANNAGGVKSDDAHERQPPPEKVLSTDDARSGTRRVQSECWQATGVKSSLLTPVARCFVIAALLIALDSVPQAVEDFRRS